MLIYAAFAYKKSDDRFKRCHFTHASMHPSCWHGCSATYPLEGSEEVSSQKLHACSMSSLFLMAVSPELLTSFILYRIYSVFPIQTHSPAKSPPSRTSMPTPPSATSQAPTPSTSSWASAWRGPSPPSSGVWGANRSGWTRGTWPFPSPSSPSWPWCAWWYCCTGGGRRWPAASWAGRGLARWSRR